MPHRTTVQKAPKHQEQDTYSTAAAGPRGIVLVPPAYGLDIVDRAGAGPLQRMPALGPGPVQPQSLVTRPSRTGLPERLKTGIEALSGYDMSDVRVHYNSSMPAQLHALAYTQSTNIHVAPGQAKHLAHEAWHAVQQKQGRVQPTMQAKG